MPKFSANLTFLFNELPLIKRWEAAAKAGFRAVECMSPYELPANEIRAILGDNGLTQALINLPMGDYAAGERGLACLPGREADFRGGVAQAIAYAEAIGCTRINCTAGIKPPAVSFDAAQSTMVANLRYAAGEMARAGIRAVTEPINFFDVPGYFVNRTDHALTLLDLVGSDNLFVQYDIYHAQRMEGELGNTLAQHIKKIGHIQLADNPGRHEPGTGEINFPWLLQHIDALGYHGWVGCEYKPMTTTVGGLGWMDGFTT